jgi:hypothetical protein
MQQSFYSNVWDSRLYSNVWDFRSAIEGLQALTDLLNKNNIAVPGDKDIMAGTWPPATVTLLSAHIAKDHI